MTAVRFEQVTVRRSGRVILDAVDWTVGAGEHWAVLGPNGAGKTTLLRVASAQTRPSAGRAAVLGGVLGRVPLADLRRRVGFVEPALGRRFHPVQTALDVVCSGFAGTILPEEGADEERARALLAAAGAASLAGQLFSSCSEGERARILLARALASEAELLVLDEPAAGLDLPGRELLLAAFDGSVGGRDGLTTITATHHLEELSPRTTHALLLRGGAVVAAGPLSEVLREEPLSTCFGLPLAVERAGGRYLVRARA
ncbi:MAG TPA: ATP-binding cassette domain-containing protein [Gaiellaceae bacterium]|nr:ATP-binding cassette domain-containing protein [Gaiellaceae bacterium]